MFGFCVFIKNDDIIAFLIKENINSFIYNIQGNLRRCDNLIILSEYKGIYLLKIFETATGHF